MSKPNPMKEAWHSGPTGRIAVTIVCLLLGPLGWLTIVVMWGIYYLDNKD